MVVQIHPTPNFQWSSKPNLVRQSVGNRPVEVQSLVLVQVQVAPHFQHAVPEWSMELISNQLNAGPNPVSVTIFQWLCGVKVVSPPSQGGDAGALPARAANFNGSID